MTDGILGKAATMEIPIHGNGEAGQLPEDDGLEQDLQQVMVSGPNLNETSIVSGGYGGSGDGLIPTGSGRHPSHGTSPSGPGDEVARGIAGEKFDIVKKWGINTYKCTKQLLSERFGRGSRTVDLELELQIELLRETKRKYESVLQLGRALTAHLYSLLQTQHALGDAFADLSQKSPELQEEFGYNAETQKLLCKNGETLLGAVNFFVSSINTLVTKTMEDTLMTVKQYEAARLEYDAYRTDLEELSLGPRDAGTRGRLESAQATFQTHRDKYEKLRGDVAIKLKFLEENKVLPYSLGPKSPSHLTVVPFPLDPPIVEWGDAAWLGSGFPCPLIPEPFRVTFLISGLCCCCCFEDLATSPRNTPEKNCPLSWGARTLDPTNRDRFLSSYYPFSFDFLESPHPKALSEQSPCALVSAWA
ncbi:arfaptin-2 isoform X1 [Arvicola amphibius]|uniref:arfaptin-2 isoform X1 n=1 Tax=Arvicola amphibius TaxID=1047088 RepID=UPI0018E37E1F|nr:arfaptin-2 isoform X1 [Arvicola amphibius]XP_038195988.1 arfaptin-2 isoform X1 [Arvicola amphibius]